MLILESSCSMRPMKLPVSRASVFLDLFSGFGKTEMVTPPTEWPEILGSEPTGRYSHPANSPTHSFFSSSRSGTCPRSKSPRSTPTTNTSIKHLFNSNFPKNKLSTRESPNCSTPSKSNSLFECSPIPWQVEKISIYWRNLFVTLLIRKQNTLRINQKYSGYYNQIVSH